MEGRKRDEKGGEGREEERSGRDRERGGMEGKGLLYRMPGIWEGRGGKGRRRREGEGGKGRKVKTPPPSIPAYAPARSRLWTGVDWTDQSVN